MHRAADEAVPPDVPADGPAESPPPGPPPVVIPDGPSEFVHLHCHTLFSVLDGIAAPRQYLEKCVERKWPAVAFTEHGNMASIPDAYFAARELGIKPLFGIELYYNDDHHRLVQFQAAGGKVAELKKSPSQRRQEFYQRLVRNRHLTVLCRNLTGYRNLLRVMKEAYERGFYYRPRVWFDLLAQHREGLIILSGCLSGPISFELRQQRHWLEEEQMTGGEAKQLAAEAQTRAVRAFLKFKKVFGEDYYVELQMPGVPGDVEVFHKLLQLARTAKVKTVLTADTHYMAREDHFIQKLLMAVDQETTVNDPELFYTASDEQFFKERADLRRLFLTKDYSQGATLRDFEEACSNTLEVADKIEHVKFDVEPKFPQIPNAPDVLRERCRTALREKGLDKDECYVKRLELELGRIIEKGFADYFLITQDVVCYSRSHGMPLGPGRGSVGGCLVSYLLRITTLDSVALGLSFDRFLSPSRGGMMLKVTV